MKKLLLILTLCVGFCNAYAELKTENCYKKSDADISNNQAGLGGKNLGSLNIEWPTEDRDGTPIGRSTNTTVILVEFHFKNFPPEEIEKIKFSPNNSVGGDYKGSKFETSGAEKIYCCFVSAGTSYIDLISPTYGNGRLELDDLNLKDRDIVSATITPDARQNITVQPIRDNGATVKVVLDDKDSAIVSDAKPQAKFMNVSHGEHELKYYANNELIKSVIVVVDNVANSFNNHDLRTYKTIDIISQPEGAAIYIDNEHVGTAPLHNYSITVGPHTFVAQLNQKEKEEKNVNIGANISNVTLYPRETQAFSVNITLDHTPYTADLYVNGDQVNKFFEKAQINQHYDTYASTYNFDLPVGNSYSFKATVGDNASKVQTVKVKKGMKDVSLIMKRHHTNEIIWPWEREYDVDIMGFQIGYVRKQLVTQGEGEKYSENGVWDDGEGKWLHGIQAGLHFQPAFKFGLGLYTGLFYEYYFSSSKEYDYSKFEEHCVYLPVHAMYRLRIAQSCALLIHGGIGLNYAIHGSYKDENSAYEDYTDFYGEDAFPKRFNMAAEISAGLRISRVMLSFTWAKGITDHKSYSSLGAFKTKQNKMSVGLSYVFSASDISH